MRVALAVFDRIAIIQAIAVGLIVIAERAAFVAAALYAGREERASVLFSAALLYALWAIRALLRAIARARLQARIHRSAARALLGGDVLAARPADTADPETLLAEGAYNGAVLGGDRLPTLAGDLVSLIAVTAVVAVTQPIVVLAFGAAVATVGASASLLASRLTSRAHDREWAAYRELMGSMLVAVRGRVDVVANAVEGVLVRRIESCAERYRRSTAIADSVAGVGARAPLAIAAAAVGAVALFRPGTFELSARTLGQGILFAAVAHVFVSIVSSSHAVWRATLIFRPMAAIISAPRRWSGGDDPVPRGRSPIVLEGVGFRYGDHADALAPVSTSFREGIPLVLSGPNGSGKTTLLRLLAGLAPPTRGSILVGGKDLAQMNLAEWRDGIAFLPQHPHFPDAGTVLDAVRMIAPAATDAEILATLDRVAVLPALRARAPSDPLSVSMSALSAGQRKRIAIARVVLRRAPVVLLDEPDSNLDGDGVVMVAELVRELAETKLVAVAAHTPALVAVSGVHVEFAA